MPKSPSQMKTNKWCITFWLTEGRTVDTLKTLTESMPSNWALEGQIEQGHDAEDKLHAQLFLITEWTRGTKIIKYFPNCYIDEAKNPFALKAYVHKEDTRVAVFKTIENRMPQWAQVCDKMFDWFITSTYYYTDMKLCDSEKWQFWDEFIGLSLEEGIKVDLIGVNPQYRACINKYWTNYINLAHRRQTDRQTNEMPSPPPPPQGGV